MCIIKKSFLLVCSLIIFFSFSALASGLTQDQKAKLIEQLQKQIYAHEKMTKEEIIQDVRNSLNTGKVALLKANPNEFQKIEANYDRMTLQAIDELNAIDDKDTIIALEKAQLQELLSARNYMFRLTRKQADDVYFSVGVIDGVIEAAFLVGAFVIDVAILPVTFIASLVSGF